MNEQANFDFFSHEKTVLDYARAAHTVGLWESEKLIFEKYIARRHAILELGAGAGRVSLGLAQAGYGNLTVTDFSPAMVEVARCVFENVPVSAKFAVEDATALSFPPARFDAVIFAFNGFQMIPHACRRARALAEIFRVLRAGGVFVFTGHDRTHPARAAHWAEERVRWDAGAQPPELDTFGDAYYSTPQGRVFIHAAVPAEMRAMLEAAGFCVEFSSLRSHICVEPPAVLDFSDDTRFWVCRKKK